MNTIYQSPMVTIWQFAQADVCTVSQGTVSQGTVSEGTIDDQNIWSGF